MFQADELYMSTSMVDTGPWRIHVDCLEDFALVFVFVFSTVLRLKQMAKWPLRNGSHSGDAWLSCDQGQRSCQLLMISLPTVEI